MTEWWLLGIGTSGGRPLAAARTSADRVEVWHRWRPSWTERPSIRQEMWLPATEALVTGFVSLECVDLAERDERGDAAR